MTCICLCGFLYASWLSFYRLGHNWQKNAQETLRVNLTISPDSSVTLRVPVEFTLSPLFVLQFRALAWTIAIALTYPTASGPLSILIQQQKNLYKIQRRVWLFPAENYFCIKSRSNSTVHDVNPPQVWLLLPNLALLYPSHAALQPSQLFAVSITPCTCAWPFLYLECPFPPVILGKTPLN